MPVTSRPAVSSDTVAQAVKAIEAGKGVSSSSATSRSVEAEAEGAQVEGTQSPYGGRSPYGIEGVEAERGEAGSTGAEEGVVGSGQVGGAREGRVVIVP